MDNLTQYGPYSPQETERAAKWLQTQGIAFEILRNDQEAREALMNDGQNVVNLADLRTGIYLAQIFYVQLKNISEIQKKDFEKLFTEKSETFLRAQQPDTTEGEEAVQLGSLRHKKQKRLVAALLAAVMIGGILWTYYKLFANA